MIRVVAQHSPTLFEILGVFPGADDTLVPAIEIDGETYYKSDVKNHYALYKRALSGWGAAGNPEDSRPVFAPGQR